MHIKTIIAPRRKPPNAPAIDKQSATDNRSIQYIIVTNTITILRMFIIVFHIIIFKL